MRYRTAKPMPAHSLAGVVACVFLVTSSGVNAQSVNQQSIREAVVKVIASQGNHVGSGIILRTTKSITYVLTAYHVIQDDLEHQGQVKIQSVSGRTYSASIDRDRYVVTQKLDLALLKVEGFSEFAPEVSWGPSNILKDKDVVWAIGHPVASGQWVVSQATVKRRQNGLIEFSASGVGPGNSGGPLLNASGEIVGIVNSMRSAVEADLARTIVTSWVPALDPDDVPLPPPSVILASGDNMPGQKDLYVAVQDQVLVFNADAIGQPTERIPIGDATKPGQALRVALAPRNGPTGEVYVVDGRRNLLVVIDQKSRQVVGDIPVGVAPRWIAITPDQKKAYVSNEGPVPNGTISVVDLKSKQEYKRIEGVNCPEGIAMSPDGLRLYVATQCGASQDPVFVVDTSSDTIIARLPGFAVGLSVLISPTGRKLYVARGGFQEADPATGRARTVSPQLAIVSTPTLKVSRTLRISPLCLAITGDGGHLLVGSDKRIDIVDTGTDAVVNTIPLATSPAGIAVSRGGSAYVWLPEEQRVLALALSGLLVRAQTSKGRTLQKSPQGPQ